MERVIVSTALLAHLVSALGVRMIAGKEVRVNPTAPASVISIGVALVQESISVAIQKMICLPVTAETPLFALIRLRTAASLLAKTTATGTAYARHLGVFAMLDGLVQVAISHRVHSIADHTVFVKMVRALAGPASKAAVVNGTIHQHGAINQHAAIPSRFLVMAL
jgi:hypothetical protein